MLTAERTNIPNSIPHCVGYLRLVFQLRLARFYVELRSQKRSRMLVKRSWVVSHAFYWLID